MNDQRAAEKIDTLIGTFFAAFDNRGGCVREAGEVIGLFAEKAVIARYRDGVCDLYTPAEFAEPRIALLRGGGLAEFHEWEETSSTRIADGIAARVSRYAKSGLLDGAPFADAGTKFFQLAKFDSEWRIVALTWSDDVDPASAGNM